MNDERYWNINLLNKWFAISSIIFMVSMIWMFIDDNDDDFKVYQRKFRQMEIENEEKKLIAELDAVKEERISFEEKLSSAQTSFEAKNSQLLEAENSLEGSKAKFYKANMNFLSKKSILDAEKFNYETAILHLHKGDDPSKIEYKYQSVVDEVSKLKLIKEEKEAAMLANEAQIKAIKLETKIAQDALNSVLKAANLVDRKLKLIDRRKMSLANKIGDIVRDLPILDFMAPYFKVEQVVLPDIKYNVNFASVPEVDRCTSCHLGISNPDYIDAEQPFTTHPNLDLYLTSSSPHPFEEFGCTGCHNGRGRGTNFVSVTHTPDNPEDKVAWKEEYDWPSGALMTWGVNRESLERGYAPGTSYTLDVYSPDLNLNKAVSSHVEVGDKELVNYRGHVQLASKLITTVNLDLGDITTLSWIDEEGITANYPLRSQRARWSEIRRFLVGRTGGLLSRRAKASSLDVMSGLQLLFDEHRDEHIAFIRSRLDLAGGVK